MEDMGDEDFYEDDSMDTDDDCPMLASDAGGQSATAAAAATSLASGDADSRSIAAYKSLSPDEIQEVMIASIRDANTLLNLPPTTTRILLQHAKWDRERLLDRFYEDRKKLFEDARIVDPESKRSRRSNRQMGAAMKCGICLEQLEPQRMSCLSCGHYFCNDCWTSYMRSKIAECSPECQCPEPTCALLADDKEIEVRLRSSPDMLNRFKQLVASSFVESNRLMKWCPTAECYSAFLLQSSDWIGLRCAKCQHWVCSLCTEDWHDPILCDLIKKWYQKNRDDSETANWMQANTKECPKCRSPIEKNGGCNHMHCTTKTCNHDFCWICLGAWKDHVVAGSYQCNKYNSDLEKSKDESRSAIRRYLFFFQRYREHLQSLRDDNKLYAKVRQQMETLHELYQLPWNETRFLLNAVEVLCDCRRTLTYTYPFAFYLSKCNQTEIFEENQADLQRATEILSESLERKLLQSDEDAPAGNEKADASLADNDDGQPKMRFVSPPKLMLKESDIVLLKHNVQNQTRYCRDRREKLVQHVHEGYEQEFWRYRE